MKNNKGFSLVELIVVIAVMAILAVTIAPALMHYIDDSRKADDIEAAGVTASSFSTVISNEDAYDAATSMGQNVVIMMAAAGDDEWTLRSGVDDPTGKLKSLMDETCPPPPVAYRKEVDASGSTSATTLDKFTPNGWAIALLNGHACVMITDGTNDGTVPAGMSLSPLDSPEYK